MIANNTESVGSFSTGIAFNYYKIKDENESELFVESKYANLKEEILNYKYIEMRHYKQEILIKAYAYYQTRLVHKMRSRNDNKDLYGISKHEVISIDRLICIILYTDYTNLSADFTSTFRKNHAFESLQATKQRHRNYYWMSRLLQETVYIYGQNYNKSNKVRKKRLQGPFFCGMSRVMTMPQFAISTLSPTSTSCHMEVAMKFSGESGIIFEFNNDKGLGLWEKGLDVSWLSRYKEEDERYKSQFNSYIAHTAYTCILFDMLCDIQIVFCKEVVASFGIEYYINQNH